MFSFPYRSRLILLSLFIFITACTERESSTTLFTAQQFLAAVKAGDVETLVNISTAPLSTYDHDWENTQDGIGFELRKRTHVRIEKRSELPDFYRRFTSRVGIEGDRATFIPVSDYRHVSDELGGTLALWRKLDTYLVVRGVADVEHIVLIGIHRKINKIQAIYTN